MLTATQVVSPLCSSHGNGFRAQNLSDWSGSCPLGRVLAVLRPGSRREGRVLSFCTSLFPGKLGSQLRKQC